MANNKGKLFETQFRQQFMDTVPNSIIIRIYDTMNGFYGISNICDFIGFKAPNMFLLECKSHAGASIPFTEISQYDKMVSYLGVPGLRIGVVLYLYDKDKIFYIPIKTLKQMKSDGKKSVGIKAIGEGYRIIEIPIVKKRVNVQADYSPLLNLQEGD